MISFDDARAIVASLAPLGVERCSLETAEGRTLAERVVSPEDLVPFARSAMDGFAVRAHDTRNAPITLHIVASVYAEAGDVREHVPLTATAIATGAALPAGADAVIPIEDAIVNGDAIVIVRPLQPETHVFPPGEDARAGDELVAAGAVLDAPQLGILASAGVTSVKVFRRPATAVITTGNELVPFDRTPAHGQIRDSNGITIAAALRSFGVASIASSTVPDERAVVRDAIERALDTADLTIVSGGASVGERDFVKDVCRELGVSFDFDSVALRPARPTGFGRRGAASIFVLPGNPAAAFTALQQFVRPAVAALGGRSDGAPARVSATLEGSLHAKRGRTFLVFARVRNENGRFIATPLDNQCSALTRLASDADGFAIVPGDGGDLHAGDAIEIDVISWQRVFTRGNVRV